MLGGILILILSGLASFIIIDILKRKHPVIDAPFLKKLFFYHLLLAFAYYGYVLFNPSDSRGYYGRVVTNHRGDTWGSFYGTSTSFIDFIGYPFIKYMGFSYEAMMALFSFFGFLGFVYFYIFFKENIKFRHTYFSYDLVTLIFLLPNLHFWASSLGKGSAIFFGLGLYFYGLNNIGKRVISLVVGGIIIYHIRPHIMLIVLISSVIGFVFSTKGVSKSLKFVFLMGAIGAFFFIYKDVLTLVGLDEEQLGTQSLDLTHRASELTKASSGVDITHYSLPMQLFTFLYRPLFVDAGGALGLIVSFENVFYLLITLKLLGNLAGLRFLITGNFLIKTAMLSFVTVSIALAQIAGNLGLAIRQKSQVMILFMFVILMFLDEQKLLQWNRQQRRRPIVKPVQPKAQIEVQ